MPFTPTRLPAGALIKMTFFGMYNARITLCQLLKTRKAMSLIETLVGFPTTVNTVNITTKLKLNFLLEQRIHINAYFTERQHIFNWSGQAATHFPYSAFC